MDKDLLPDGVVLSAIFSSSQPKYVEISANCFTNCTFKANFDVQPSVVVRMETSIGMLEPVVALQKVARLQIPELVPETVSFGETLTADQRAVEYTVTAFVPYAVKLESVWSSLDVAEKEALVDGVVEAIAKLQRINPSDGVVRELICKTPSLKGEDKPMIGGSSSEYAKNIHELLANLAAKHQLKQTITSSVSAAQNGDGIHIQSPLPELDDVHILIRDLQILQESAVLCHNDIEPRNLLVRKSQENVVARYELAALID